MVTAFVSGVRSIGQSLRAPAQTLNRAQSVRETQQGLQTRYDFWRAVYGNEAYGDLSAAQSHSQSQVIRFPLRPSRRKTRSLPNRLPVRSITLVE